MVRWFWLSETGWPWRLVRVGCSLLDTSLNPLEVVWGRRFCGLPARRPTQSNRTCERRRSPAWANGDGVGNRVPAPDGSKWHPVAPPQAPIWRHIEPIGPRMTPIGLHIGVIRAVQRLADIASRTMSFVRSNSDTTGPATVLAVADSTPGWGCVGAIASAARTMLTRGFNSDAATSRRR